MWKDIVSSAIQSVFYSDRQQTLFVRFPSGKQWGYEVSRAEFKAMMAASSHGSYFSANIRGKVPEREYSDDEMALVFSQEPRQQRKTRQQREEGALVWAAFRQKYGLQPYF